MSTRSEVRFSTAAPSMGRKGSSAVTPPAWRIPTAAETNGPPQANRQPSRRPGIAEQRIGEARHAESLIRALRAVMEASRALASDQFLTVLANANEGDLHERSLRVFVVDTRNRACPKHRFADARASKCAKGRSRSLAGAFLGYPGCTRVRMRYQYSGARYLYSTSTIPIAYRCSTSTVWVQHVYSMCAV